MKRAFVAASVAALLLPVAWTAPAQAVEGCGALPCVRECDQYVDLVVPGGKPTIDDAMRACFAEANAAGDLNVASQRAKGTGYTTLNPGRVTAMAKRFVRSPGDVINIHGYGPDQAIALAKAEHVREQLVSEVARLGGDPDTYPTFVVYAGDPIQKQGVDVTIHQQAGTKHTKASAWVNTHLDSKSSTLTDEQRDTVTTHLVAASTPEQVQAKWDIDMNEDVSLVDAAEITAIARYFLDHPDQHILVHDHVGTGVHGSTVADAVVAEMSRLAAEDGVIRTRGFLDWLNQAIVVVNDFTDDLNAAEVEIHAVTVTLDDAATSIANVITDTTTLVGDLIKDVETVVNPIVAAVDDAVVIAKTVKDVVAVVAAPL